MLKHSSQHKTPTKQKKKSDFLSVLLSDMGMWRPWGALACSHSALKGLSNRSVCEHLHIPFVYGERAYLRLGLRHGMWIFLKSSSFFSSELPGGLYNRAVFQFLVSLICGVSVLDMLRGASIVEFHIDCACWDRSLS